VTAVEGIFWAALCWSVFFLYALCDAPTLVIRWKRGRR
jgi:hypothetical protein